MRKVKITKNTTLAKILEKKGAEGVLEENGVPCVFCPMAKFEMEKLQIGEVCKMYGINLDKLLNELNKK